MTRGPSDLCESSHARAAASTSTTNSAFAYIGLTIKMDRAAHFDSMPEGNLAFDLNCECIGIHTCRARCSRLVLFAGGRWRWPPADSAQPSRSNVRRPRRCLDRALRGAGSKRGRQTWRPSCTAPAAPTATVDLHAPCHLPPRSQLNNSSSVGRSAKSLPVNDHPTDPSLLMAKIAGLARPPSASFHTPQSLITRPSGSLKSGKGSSSLSTMARLFSTGSTEIPTRLTASPMNRSQLLAYEANCPLQ